MNEKLRITVICPTFNEAKYIERALDFFVRAKPAEKELLVIDGGSGDGTREIIIDWSKRHGNIFLIDNRDKYVPYALNKGIEISRGEIIVRLDAHTEYAEDYLEKILGTFEQTEADIVGGPMNATGKTDFQKAVAGATSSVFGIGDSKFHNKNYRGYTDSVYLGAWRRTIFKETGTFDIKFLRNQDDEFHYRAKSLGKKIYLNPDIISYYYPRDSLEALFKQYFQYGLFKPLVLKKIKSETKIRHLIPILFVIYLLVCIIFFFCCKVLLIPLGLYIILDILFSFSIKGNISIKLLALAVFPVLHISYGLGFLFGLSEKARKRLFK
jgi:succinoglycan biosynthesis protein ExoA